VLAIGLLHLALMRGRRIHYFGAVLATALVPLCSWPAFVAMLMAIVSYLLSRDPAEWKRMIIRLIAIGAVAYSLVAEWIPPSTVWALFLRTRVIMGAPRPGAGRVLAAVGCCILLVGLWLLFRRSRLPFWFRFAAFDLALTGGITLTSFYTGVQLLTQSER